MTAVALLAAGLPMDSVLTRRHAVDVALAVFGIAGGRRLASKVLLDLRQLTDLFEETMT